MENIDVVLEMRNISKRFPGVKALDGVNFKLKRGTVHALMGENGAGKSTLMKCAYGLYIPDEGSIFLEGRQVSFTSPKDGLEAGITMIPQEMSPIPMRSLAENIWVGRYPTKKVLGMDFVDHRKMNEETQALFDDLEMSVSPTDIPAHLGASILQLNEIAKAISYDAKVIIMDEPTSSLTLKETDVLFKTIRKLIARGISIVYISHKIDEILQISDEVTILRDGKYTGTWPASELTSELIVNRMVGRKLGNWFPTIDNSPEDICLEVKDFSSANLQSFKNCSFSLKKGEILGVAGLVGAQRTELLEAIFGLRPIVSGEIIKNKKKIINRNSLDAIKNGFGLLTEERRRNGIIAGASVLDNATIANINFYSNTLGFLDLKRMAEDANVYVQRINVKTPTMQTRVGALSGGNQQKVLIARWLLTNPDILIMDEPTRGIDVGAKSEIYNIILELARQGKSIIFISSEMPEIIGISNRVMVMCEGRISAFLEGEQIREEVIMDFASKVHGTGTYNINNC